MRAIAVMSDRVLGLLVPRVTAKADPCGVLVTKYCYCSVYAGKPYTYYKQCCSISGSCYPCRRSASAGC